MSCPSACHITYIVKENDKKDKFNSIVTLDPIFNGEINMTSMCSPSGLFELDCEQSLMFLQLTTCARKRRAAPRDTRDKGGSPR